MADLDTTRFGLIVDYLLEQLPTIPQFPLVEGWVDSGNAIMIGRAELDTDWASIGARTRDEGTVVHLILRASIDGADELTEVRHLATQAVNQFCRGFRTDQTTISLGGLCASSMIRATNAGGILTPDGSEYFISLELATFHSRF